MSKRILSNSRIAGCKNYHNDLEDQTNNIIIKGNQEMNYEQLYYEYMREKKYSITIYTIN